MQSLNTFMNVWFLQTDYRFTLKGNHGYDNKEDDMKTTFIAYGPSFKSGETLETMNSVDLYPLMCEVLELSSCHDSRGSLSKTEGLLITSAAVNMFSSVYTLVMSVIAVSISS